MLSVIAGALLFVGSLYTGAGVKRYYKIRMRYFEETVNLCNLLTDEITNLKTPLLKIFDNFILTKKDELSKHIATFSELLQREVTPDKSAVLNILDVFYLKRAERSVIADFLLTLGKSRAESQASNIKHYQNKLDELFKRAKEAYRVQGTLAYKLGILLGIALMIIVV